ncbi:class F sortase [Modestobacter sp. VKM Ac-2983]|uniref:class F sortase n=1 Tax=Modestobacter sp. VKM Ac-2983 TaxID=3004137 RepID=UPI0022AB820E|nr:class F sortase [Modestobacter sp. VKM Ac-2983]MCZ2806682.1 class F sortase [Modestobacter sp. VKM Ac-2983]
MTTSTGPGRPSRPGRHRLTALRAGLLAVAVLAGGMALVDRPADAVRSTAVASPPAPALLGPAAAVPAQPTVAPPVGLRIAAIGVDAHLVPIGVDGAGALVPPADVQQAGWFTAGPVPGAVGPAVLAGHVDDHTGPGVFSRLEELTAGDQVVVTGSDGRPVTFTVTRVSAHPKGDFPTEEVYGPTTGAELRLITCGGTFDRSRRSYTDNVVVHASAG